jgi:acetyltransferase-like isoleucine patch superfamily enzyme
VAIGSGTHILSGKHQHGFEDLDTPILEQKGYYEQITIGENSWIGNGSVIMANLGRHNIIGAGSVITRDTEDFKVIAGNPARVIRDLRPNQ